MVHALQSAISTTPDSGRVVSSRIDGLEQLLPRRQTGSSWVGKAASRRIWTPVCRESSDKAFAGCYTGRLQDPEYVGPMTLPRSNVYRRTNERSQNVRQRQLCTFSELRGLGFRDEIVPKIYIEAVYHPESSLCIYLAR